MSIYVPPMQQRFTGYDSGRNTARNLLDAVRMKSQMEANQRQLALQQDRLDENIRRFDINTGLRTDAVEQNKLANKANKAMAEQELNIRRQKEAQIDFDRRKLEYDSQPLVKLGLIEDFDDATGLSRPVLPERRLPGFYQGLPSYGLSNLFLPNQTENDILLNARMQGLIQKGK